jgi:hypothetical protein
MSAVRYVEFGADGTYVNAILMEPGFDYQEASIGHILVEHETASRGWTYVGGQVVAPMVEPVAIDLYAYAANKRFDVETGGITVNGVAVDTSRSSQSMIDAAYSYARKNPDKTIKFKAVSGWVSLDATTMIAIAQAVGDHVQACFAMEATVAGEIEAGTITTTAEIDAADWPG